MSYTVQEFVCENGFKPVLEALHDFKQGDIVWHEFAEENDIDEQSWFEFGWMVNEHLGGVGHDAIPLVDFNYCEIEREAERYVGYNAPVEWADLVDSVTARVESASTSDVNGWLELANVEEDDERRVTAISFDN